MTVKAFGKLSMHIATPSSTKCRGVSMSKKPVEESPLKYIRLPEKKAREEQYRSQTQKGQTENKQGKVETQTQRPCGYEAEITTEDEKARPHRTLSAKDVLKSKDKGP